MTAATIDLDATFTAVAHYECGDERRPLHDLEQLVLYAHSLAGDDPQGFRVRLADRMITLLTSPNPTPAAKVFVCSQLADIDAVTIATLDSWHVVHALGGFLKTTRCATIR